MLSEDDKNNPKTTPAELLFKIIKAKSKALVVTGKTLTLLYIRNRSCGVG